MKISMKELAKDSVTFLMLIVILALVIFVSGCGSGVAPEETSDPLEEQYNKNQELQKLGEDGDIIFYRGEPLMIVGYVNGTLVAQYQDRTSITFYYEDLPELTRFHSDSVCAGAPDLQINIEGWDCQPVNTGAY